MKFGLFSIILALFSGYVFVATPAVASAVKPIQSSIILNSFTGTYRLSRDSRGLSLLSSQEAIVADFPAGNTFYGITRELPKLYQNQSLNTKILSVTDAAGNSLPYKVTDGANDYIVITVGDPAITLLGSQTFKIAYQTSGVVNLSQKNNEFLLNVNGRGWNQPFGKVNATLYIPNSFQASLVGSPICYNVLNTAKQNNCEIDTKKTAEETVVSLSSQNLQPQQALVLKMSFNSSTFTNKQAPLSKRLMIGVSLAVLLAALALRLLIRKKTK